VKRYSFVQLLRNAIGLGDGWQQAWRSPEPKPSYDVSAAAGMA
jgi:sarcosine oxidase subunit beta